jgi:Beta-L-arabinofuranosidase, GH127
MQARPAGDCEMKSRSDYIVSELARCQQNLGDGYLSAFPAEHFDRLQALQPVWAPYYVVRVCFVILSSGTHAMTASSAAGKA